MDPSFYSARCVFYFCARLCIVALCSPVGKGLTSWHSSVMSNCDFFFYFPVGVLGQVWYLIVSISDLCTLSYAVLSVPCSL